MKKTCNFCKKQKKNMHSIFEPGQEIITGYICQKCYEQNMNAQADIENIGDKIGIIEASAVDVEKAVINKMTEIGPVLSGKNLNIDYQQIQQYLSGKRKMKFERIIEFAKKLLI